MDVCALRKWARIDLLCSDVGCAKPCYRHLSAPFSFLEKGFFYSAKASINFEALSLICFLTAFAFTSFSLQSISTSPAIGSQTSPSRLERASAAASRHCCGLPPRSWAAADAAIGGLLWTVEEYYRAVEAVTLESVVEAANTVTLHTTFFLKGVAK